MTDQPKHDEQDDVEAHRYRWNHDEEAPTEKPTGADPAADDDVEGHMPRRGPAEARRRNPADDDVEGHAYRPRG